MAKPRMLRRPTVLLAFRFGGKVIPEQSESDYEICRITPRQRRIGEWLFFERDLAAAHGFLLPTV
jgi:hypothetical protein